MATNNQLVLEAPPGAGKTTLVPLALLEQPWLAEQKIIVLQPRRMAARSTATRMASLLGESVGQRVGYRVRMESRISKHTRIEVVTEGVLTRMLLDDPALDGVGLVIFDEFHERHLESDVGLAFCLQGRSLFREESQPLKILLMSATLEGNRLAEFLENAPLISSEGKMYPVSLVYGAAQRVGQPIIESVVSATLAALKEHSGSILVFLPGQGEIQKIKSQLENRLPEEFKTTTEIFPLYGALALDDQQLAIGSITNGKRKVVLSTDIAETSLTIEGITVVIDSGLKRVSQFDPNNGMSRLHTHRISRASSVQRMGRAGRLSKGVCYRLWSESEQNTLRPYDSPEILQADLCPLVLQLFSWGVNHPEELDWLDLPPKGPYNQALDLLLSLGALESSKSREGLALTEHGKSMASLALHPRLAHMLLCAFKEGLSEEGALLAAMLSERDPYRQNGVDLSLRMQVLEAERPCEARHRGWMKRVKQQAKIYLRQINVENKAPEYAIHQTDALGYLAACAFPDRIAKPRSAGIEGQWQLSSGAGVEISEEDNLAQADWLAVAEVGGIAHRNGQNRPSRIFLAAHLNPELFSNELSRLLTRKEVVEWDKRTERFVAEEHDCIGKLVLHKRSLTQVPIEAKQRAIIELIKTRGLESLPWPDHLKQWLARVNLIYFHLEEKGDWPDLSEQALNNTLGQWLAPYLDNVNSIKDISKIDVSSILKALLPWALSQQLESLAPAVYRVPSGSKITINYLHTPPVLAVKLQEMFGSAETPTIINGKVTLLVHLLSPAKRPLQVTQDLAGFWANSYSDVKKDMRGRYPKHPWPDDPMNETPTRKLKHR
ncbi:MAG: ATP-dependent helicase HrpB [Pseudomonadales bacterium]|nr:ATP-dependent helicase HrpB [Pseudomonadales bacterium]